MLYELKCLLMVSIDNPIDTSINRLLMFGVFILLAVHDRTSLFSRPLSPYSVRNLRLGITGVAIVVVLIYLDRFMSIPLAARVHKFAGTHSVLIFIYSIYCAIILGSDRVIGFKRS